MSSSPFMDDYSSEDYSDHDDDYYFVPTATNSDPQVRAQVEIQTKSNELQNLIVDKQEDVSESVYFDVLPELQAETAEEGGGIMEQSIYLAVESYFVLEAQAESGVAAALEAETAVEELTVESCFHLEAQAETGVAAALEAETAVEELAVGSYFDFEAEAESGVAAALEAETAVEELAVESYFHLEAQAESGVTAALEAETMVEELAVGSFFHLEAQAETALPTALETESELEEGDVIESESLETIEADTPVETVERMIEEFIYEAVESESDLEAEDAIEEPNLDVEHEADAVAPEAEITVEEGDVIGESIYEAVKSDFDLDAEAEAQDMVEEEDDVVEEEDDVVEEEDDTVEEEEEDMVDDMVEDLGDNFVEEDSDDMVEEEDDTVEEEHDVIDEPLESDNNLQAEALVEEGAAMEPGVSTEITTFKAQEPDSDLEPEEPEDLIDEQSDSCEEEESDLSEEEWDSSDAEESDKDSMDYSSDSDLTEEEEDDDVVVSYLNSSTTIRNKAWKSLVPGASIALASWAKLPVLTDTTTTLEDFPLRESFLGCSPMLMLQECGNAMMNVIETLLCELLRIRNGLRRVLGALFRKTETTKHA